MMARYRWIAISIATLLPSIASCVSDQTIREPPTWAAEVVAVYPHDRAAFTEGLVFHAGKLYESTGGYGHSSLRRVDITSGAVEQRRNLDRKTFGEGIAIVGNRLYQLTWKQGRAIVYDLATFEPVKTFRYAGEGWGLTQDGVHLIMSDGTATLRFLDPATFRVVRKLHVHDGATPVRRLNELEYIDGEIWANIWHDDRIVRISPTTGDVLGWINLASLYPASHRLPEAVLNGIAWDRTGRRLFVTGKDWPDLYQIRVVHPVTTPR